jgi:LmbE family N-acetylglucosaminyl deacetylase
MRRRIGWLTSMALLAGLFGGGPVEAADESFSDPERRIRFLSPDPHPRLVGLWHRILVTFGQDVTELSRGRSCLVLAAHPDDETLGCGATIARKREARTPVKVVIATDGRHSSTSQLIGDTKLAKIREAEAREATGTLGLGPGDVVFLKHEDGSLASRLDELTAQVADVLEHFAPEEVLVTSALDGHPDHTALSMVARRLSESQRGSYRVAEYPIWYWFAGPFGGQAGHRGWSMVRELIACAPRLGPEVVATAGHLETKRLALDAYRSQATNLTGEPTWNVLTEEFRRCFLQPQEIFFHSVADRGQWTLRSLAGRVRRRFHAQGETS